MERSDAPVALAGADAAAEEGIELAQSLCDHGADFGIMGRLLERRVHEQAASRLASDRATISSRKVVIAARGGRLASSRLIRSRMFASR